MGYEGLSRLPPDMKWEGGELVTGNKETKPLIEAFDSNKRDAFKKITEEKPSSSIEVDPDVFEEANAQRRAMQEKALAAAEKRAYLAAEAAKPPKFYPVEGGSEPIPGTGFVSKNKGNLPPSKRGKDGKPKGFFGRLFS